MTVGLAVPADDPPGAPEGASWRDALAGLCRIEEVLQPAAAATNVGESRRPDLIPGLTAAVAAAYHGHLAEQCRPLFLAWCRPYRGAPVTVLSAAQPADADTTSALSFPPGTRGCPVPDGDAMGLLAAMRAWAPIGGAVDTLLSALGSGASAVSGDAARPLEERLLAAWHGPFAWTLIAHPVPVDELEREAQASAAAERDARTRGSSPQYSVAAERHARRHLDLRAGFSTGLWRVRLLAGGADEASAAAIAGLLVAGTNLGGTPYALAPLTAVDDLGKALVTQVEGPGGHGFPFLAPSALLARLAHVPDTEIPGVRIVERPTFDVTPETSHASTAGSSVELGTVLDHDGLAAGALGIGTDAVNRHVFVCGATGAGKSQTVRALLESLARLPRPVPWLVIEPAKAEYAGMAGRLPGAGAVLVVRPGQADAIPACLNPLEPEPGFPLQTHIDLVRALFQAAFEAYEPFPQVLARALTRCYEDLGWQVTLGEPVNLAIRPRYPRLSDLRRVALRVVDQIGYGREVTDNVRGFIDVRLASLTLGTPGRFFEGGHPLDLAALLERNTVLELEDIGNDQDKAFFIGAVLIRVAEHLRVRHRAQGHAGLRHVTVIEEAHRLLRRVEPDDPAAHAVELFANLLAEVRAYGEGIVVAEQIPSKIITDVVKNSAVKIMHRLPARDDRDDVGATMNLTKAQSRHVVTLPPGHAAVFADGMDRPVLAAMLLGENRESDAGIDRTPPLASIRSAACGRECGERPCTVREMTSGARLADEPRVTLWIELLTIAHIVGEPAPRPDPGWLAQLAASGAPRGVHCALGHTIQRSVDARYTGLARHYRPEALARHLADHAAGVLAGESGTCDGSEVQWQSAHFRWIDVQRALQQGHATDPAHPDTAAWRERGLDLPGETLCEQLEHFKRRPEVWQRDPETVRGTATPPLFEQAADELDNHTEPVDRLTRAMSFLTLTTSWPQLRLYRQAWQSRSLGT